MSFTAVIVGRPNVGKSTLFNRLVGRPTAIVDDTPGVTRDWREGEGRIAELGFRVIDTAGLEEAAPSSLAGRMRAGSERLLAEADVALAGIAEANALGFGEPVAISAQHGEGMAELYEALAPFAAAREECGSSSDEASRPLHLAIVGRPNVGKSTLLNRLLEAERVLTGPEPGITRDAVAV